MLNDPGDECAGNVTVQCIDYLSKIYIKPDVKDAVILAERYYDTFGRDCMLHDDFLYLQVMFASFLYLTCLLCSLAGYGNILHEPVALFKPHDVVPLIKEDMLANYPKKTVRNLLDLEEVLIFLLLGFV